MNLFIDPYLLACPDVYDENGIDNYITTLLDWKFLQHTKWTKIYKISNCEHILHENGKYPAWDDVRATFKKYNIVHIDPRDVADIINSVISKSTSIEAHLLIDDMLLDNYFAEPQDELSNRQESFVSSLCEILALAFLKCQINNESFDQQVLITKGTNAESIFYNGQIALIEPEELHGNLSLDVSFDMKAFYQAKDLFMKIDPVSLFNRNILDSSNLFMSINISTFQLATAAGVEYNMEDLEYTLTLGAEFINNIKALNFDTIDTRKKMLLRSISEVILKINMSATHHIRTSVGGNSSQLMNGRKAAWRRDIDHEYHLHYWLSDGKIEIANLVTHNNFNIS